MFKLLAEISDKSLGIDDIEVLGNSYRLRKSARVILLNDAGEMATQYLTNYTYHKLPGGGVDPGETLEEAAVREIREEVGCDSQIVSAVGMTIEYRNEHNLLHISYCFVAKVIGEVGETALEAGEIEEGQITKWLKPVDVLERMKSDAPDKQEGFFILKREMSFLTEYLSQKINSGCRCVILSTYGMVWADAAKADYKNRIQKSLKSYIR